MFLLMGWRNAQTPENVGLYFSWSKQAELGWPPAPSPITAQGSGVMLLEAPPALLLQAVFTTQLHP